jgi:outer membrane receptor for ferrienterochelin and colicin
MTKLKNTFLFSLLAFAIVAVADNPGEDVADNEAEQVVETVIEEASQTESVDEDTSSDTPAETDDGVVTLEKVTVTGSRIKRSQVEGATPLIVITKQDMKDNGYRNLTEALQSLPIANAATQNESQVNTFTPNANELDLRRFGPGRVLVLVNGRRMADYPFP